MENSRLLADKKDGGRIGILGGSFDPFHLGHLSIAEVAKKSLDLNKVCLVPAYEQPFKDGHLATWDQRVEMVNLVAQEYDFIDVLTIEGERKQKSYTYDTVMELKKYGYHDIILIMGSDSLMSIERWYKSEELLKSCSLGIAMRPTISKAKVESLVSNLTERYSTEVKLLKNDLIWISSTEIKDLCRKGCSIEHMVPESVRCYIEARGLYV